MSELKYKVGDKVRVNSIDWYNKNKDEYGDIDISHDFTFYADRSKYCGRVFTISEVFDNSYFVKEDNNEYYWTDEMIEGLMEEEGKETSWKPSKEEMDVLYSLAYITNKYDEHKEEVITRLYQDLKREFFNGSSYENMFPNTENDVRRRSTIQVLEYARSLDNYNQYGKADIDKNIAWLEKQGKSALEARTDNELVEEEVGLVDNLSSRWVNEFNLPEGYIFKDENGKEILTSKIILEKKKKEATYPKTYEECEKVLRYDSHRLNNMGVTVQGYKWELIRAFQILIICRDAYWKLAGEEMGLGKPWKPDWNDGKLKWCMSYSGNCIEFDQYKSKHHTLAFPTPEMLDAFYENFEELIEQCKELL